MSGIFIITSYFPHLAWIGVVDSDAA